MKPHIYKRHYISSGKSCWAVKPVGHKWRTLTESEQRAWTLANRYASQLNMGSEMREVAQRYIDKYGIEGLVFPANRWAVRLSERPEEFTSKGPFVIKRYDADGKLISIAPHEGSISA